jgi:3-deoxy-D-manno-octulosonic-acid transferase
MNAPPPHGPSAAASPGGGWVWLLYRLLYPVGMLLLLPHFLWRMRRRGGYGPHFGERFARYDAPTRARLAGGGRCWIHAVSVGEFYVALAFARELRRRRPGLDFVFTVNTPTARAIAEAQADPRDVTLYVPLDLPSVVRRAMALIRPSAFFLMEGEWWPMLIREAAARGVPVALINGRLSDRSFRGYRRVGFGMRRLLPLLRGLFAQSAEVRERLIALGAPPARVQVPGSAKYEVATRDPAAEADARRALEAIGWGAAARILLGGSTWPGEEALLLDAFRDLRVEFPALVLLLAPRHAERRAQVRALLEASGLPFVLRSESRGRAAPAAGLPPAVMLLDTTGELRHFYASAEVIFIGKSLCAEGGQNPIEPAVCGRPVVTGPHMENFRQVMADFRAAAAVCEVRDAPALRTELRRLLTQPGEAASMGARAAALVRAQTGALSRTADVVAPWIEASGAAGEERERPCDMHA